MSVAMLPCETEDSPDIQALRDLVEEHDEILEICMTDRLSEEEKEDLEVLYTRLKKIEESYWGGVEPVIFNAIVVHSDLDFPMIRHLLGQIPAPTFEI